MSTRRRVSLGAGALLVGGAALVPFVWPGDATATNTGNSDQDGPGVSASASTETVAVTLGDLVQKAEANGTVGYGNKTTLPIEATGLVTESPESGALLQPGDTVVRVEDRPVTLALGTQPLYRELRRVPSGERDDAGDRLGLQEGVDVEQLQNFLLGAGFDDKGRLEADGTFGITTERAVEDWQRSVGHAATGKVDRSQLVFIAGPVRIDSAPAVGESFSSVDATSNVPTVSTSVTSKQRPFFEVGSSVALESGGATATGTVTSLKRTVGDDGSTRYDAEIQLDDGEDLGGAETAKVIASRTTASGVLTVPVRALIALAEGGWAVQVDTPGGPTLTAVELGDVVDGLAEITGVDEGTELVVPV